MGYVLSFVMCVDCENLMECRAEKRKYGWLPQKFPWKEILKEVILHFTDIDQDMIKVYKNTFPGLIWWYHTWRNKKCIVGKLKKEFYLS